MGKLLSISTALLLALLVLASPGTAETSYAPPTVRPKAEITTTEATVGRTPWVKINVRCVAPEAGFVCAGIISMSGLHPCCPAVYSPPLTHVRHYVLPAGTERKIAIQLRQRPSALFEHLHTPTFKSSVLVTVDEGEQAIQQVLLRWKPRD